VRELDIRDLIRSTRNKRDRILLAVTYVAGLRVSEVVALNCADIIERSDGRLQLHILGKGGKERDILLPASLGPLLRELCEGRAPGDPVFRSRKGDQRLTDRVVNYLVKRLALRAGINPKLSAHWLRHAHASQALDRGAPLSLVTGTLGHANVATTSVYLHAKPGTSSGDQLDPDVRAAK
jgi:site-specific recombinase XerD